MLSVSATPCASGLSPGSGGSTAVGGGGGGGVGCAGGGAPGAGVGCALAPATPPPIAPAASAAPTAAMILFFRVSIVGPFSNSADLAVVPTLHTRSCGLAERG